VLSLIATGVIILVAMIVFGGASAGLSEARQIARESADRASLKAAKTDYINNSIELYDFKSGYHETYDGTFPGVEFKLRNKGKCALREVDVTVYFLDRNGEVISEKTFYPVLSSDHEDEQLKPGYIWQLERGKFYSAKNVPTEWVTGHAYGKITDIEFAELPAR
jgi:hypothetical protein